MLTVKNLRKLRFGSLFRMLLLAVLINSFIAIATLIWAQYSLNAKLPTVTSANLDPNLEMGWVRFRKIGYQVFLVELGDSGLVIPSTHSGTISDFPKFAIASSDDFEIRRIDQSLYFAMTKVVGGSLDPNDEAATTLVWQDDGTPLSDEEIDVAIKTRREDFVAIQRMLGLLGDTEEDWLHPPSKELSGRRWRMKFSTYEEYTYGLFSINACGWPVPSIYSVCFHGDTYRGTQNLGTSFSWLDFVLSTSLWFLPLAFVRTAGIWALGYYRTRMTRCIKCGYDLRGAGFEAGCPECGWNRPAIRCGTTEMKNSYH